MRLDQGQILKVDFYFYSWEFLSSAKGTYSVGKEIKYAYAILYLYVSS